MGYFCKFGWATAQYVVTGLCQQAIARQQTATGVHPGIDLAQALKPTSGQQLDHLNGYHCDEVLQAFRAARFDLTKQC